jgi:hypothetical protein
MLVRYFTRPSRIKQLRSSTGGHLLEAFANELSQGRYQRVAARKHIRSAEHFLHWIARRNLPITSVEQRYAHMAALKVRVREFRERIATFLESDTPVAVTRRGETLGVYVPTLGKTTQSSGAF